MNASYVSPSGVRDKTRQVSVAKTASVALNMNGVNYVI